MAQSGVVLFAVKIEEAELLEAWCAARAIVDRTGRWPAVGGDIYPAPSIDVSPLECCFGRERSTGGRDWERFGEQLFGELRAAQEHAWKPSPLTDRLQYQLGRTQSGYGAAPRPAEILERFASDVRDVDLEHWLLEWEEARRPTTRPLESGHLDWFFDPSCALMFYPTPSGPCSIAYEPFYGERDMPGLTTRRLIIILEFWRRIFGAELVANWGTMLQFVVARPPTTLEQGWALAIQQALVAPDTIIGPGVPLRDHARTLIARPTWLLHCRP